MTELEEAIQKLEQEMSSPAFWNDKQRAQEKVRELARLKERAAQARRYDAGNAVVTIFAGAGGDDAEDWARMLFEMYTRFCERHGYTVRALHKNENDYHGIRNITFEVHGPGAYKTLKHEAGVHRLVRISPFSARKQRHTSFAMVEVIPEIVPDDVVLAPEDIKVEFAKAGGPGGQNVNKRETSVRVIHIPTGIAVQCDSERSQAQNRARALNLLKAKLHFLQQQRAEEERGRYAVSKIQSAEWGNQIRSYILHPYKLVKDHRTGIEHKDPSRVLEEGDLDIFISAEKDIA